MTDVLTDYVATIKAYMDPQTGMFPPHPLQGVRQAVGCRREPPRR